MERYNSNAEQETKWQMMQNTETGCTMKEQRMRNIQVEIGIRNWVKPEV